LGGHKARPYGCLAELQCLPASLAIIWADTRPAPTLRVLTDIPPNALFFIKFLNKTVEIRAEM